MTLAVKKADNRSLKSAWFDSESSISLDALLLKLRQDVKDKREFAICYCVCHLCTKIYSHIY